MVEHRDRNRASQGTGLAALAALRLALTACSSVSAPPRVSEGFLDLSGWSFERGGPVRLRGDWQFCWGAFVDPTTQDCPGPAASWEPFPVPRLWNDATASSPIGGRGIASYRASVALPGDAGGLSLRVGSPMTAYELFVNG